MEKIITVWHMNGVMDAGGTETLIMNIFRYRTGKIKHILVVHSNDEKRIGIYDEEIVNLGIKILHLPPVGTVGPRKYAKLFYNLVNKEGKPDIIHCHLNAVGGVIAMAAKKAGIKHRIIHCHADIKFRGTKSKIFLSEFKLYILKKFVNYYGTDFFACSSRAASRLFYTPERAVIIKNAISVEKYLCSHDKYVTVRKKFKIDNDTIVIGAVGRISRIKNYEIIIKCLPELIKLGCKIKFVCFGRIADKQYFSELRYLCESLNLNNSVQFFGNSDQIFNDIAAFDIFVMPSITEGFGISALEAQAAGKYCLLSNGIPKEVDMKLNLVTFLNPNNMEEWKNNIANYRQVEILPEYILSSFNKYGYNALHEVKKIEDIYTKIAGNK